MIGIVSHDAGGAEVLSSWLRQCNEPYCLVLEGPAKAIFQRKLGNCESISLHEAISQSDWVLCGTSWQSNLERLAVIQAKAAGKKVVAFLDHWVNYKERFLEQGDSVLPDEVWVGDVDAEGIARILFEGLPIVLKPNPYFQDLQSELERLKPRLIGEEQCSVLYIGEPISKHALLQHGNERYWGYTEDDALKYFLNNLNALGTPISKITIRPHPSESASTYDWVKQSFALPIEIGGMKTLIEEIAEANVVVGCESMGMVVGLLAKKRVVCSIPPGGRVCSLPHKEIDHMQALIASYQSQENA
ncbi:MAG: hypothetical protein ABII81_09640 [Pseudomonadota bacterium]